MIRSNVGQRDLEESGRTTETVFVPLERAYAIFLGLDPLIPPILHFSVALRLLHFR